jgi:pyruvate, water dikinase
MGKRNVLMLLKKMFHNLVTRKEARVSFNQVFEHFQDLLEDHQRAMEIIADLGEKSGGDYIFDRKYLSDAIQDLQHLMLRMSKGLNFISSDRYLTLYSAIERVFSPISADLRGRLTVADAPYVISLRDAPLDTPELIGGKASTLAEIRGRLNIRVPTAL